MATSTNWSGLTEYIDVNRDRLITEVSADAKSIRYFDVALNVKHKEMFPLLTSEVVLQDGSACGWNPQGSDNFGEIELEVFPTEVEKEWCQRDLEKSFANYQLKWAAGRETLPFEEAIHRQNVEKTQEALEIAIWSGNTATSMPGILAQLDALSAYTIDAEVTSAMTIVEKIDQYVAKVPNKAFKAGRDGKVHIFLSYSDFRAYIAALNATCCSKQPLVDAAIEEYVYPGDSRIILIPVEGLENLGKIVAVPAEGFVYATDVEGSENIYDGWFDRKDAKFMFRILFMAGTGVKFPMYVVINK